jgi:hypothetical protein
MDTNKKPVFNITNLYTAEALNQEGIYETHIKALNTLLNSINSKNIDIVSQQLRGIGSNGGILEGKDEAPVNEIIEKGLLFIAKYKEYLNQKKSTRKNQYVFFFFLFFFKLS